MGVIDEDGERLPRVDRLHPAGHAVGVLQRVRGLVLVGAEGGGGTQSGKGVRDVEVAGQRHLDGGLAERALDEEARARRVELDVHWPSGPRPDPTAENVTSPSPYASAISAARRRPYSSSMFTTATGGLPSPSKRRRLAVK